LDRVVGARKYVEICNGSLGLGRSSGIRAASVLYPFDMSFLAAAIRIINEVKGINRVVYDVTSKPPGTIEWN